MYRRRIRKDRAAVFYGHRSGRRGNQGFHGGIWPTSPPRTIPKEGQEPVKRGAGFTLLEILVVLVILGITLAVVATTFNRYLDRSQARHAAEIFAQDLTAARNTASRSRQRVTVDFDEGNRSYLVRVEAGDTLFHRFFDDGAELTLSSLNLQMTGDSVAFNGQGIADLSGAGGTLGRAVFTSGNTTYAVSFNSMGSSRVNGS